MVCSVPAGCVLPHGTSCFCAISRNTDNSATEIRIYTPTVISTYVSLRYQLTGFLLFSESPNAHC